MSENKGRDTEIRCGSSREKWSSVRDQMKENPFLPGQMFWFPIASFAGVIVELAVPLPHVCRPYPPLTSLFPCGVALKGPHSTSAGTILWWCIYLKSYKYAFVDRITITVKQHGLGQGYEKMKPFYSEYKE